MGDFFQAYQETLVKPGLPCFYSEVQDFNQAYQENLVKPGLQCLQTRFTRKHRNFQQGLPGKPGNIRLTNHFCLGFFGRNLIGKLQPGLTRLYCQKPVKSGSTMVYQVHQAFNQTFGGRVTLRCLEHSLEIIIHNLQNISSLYLFKCCQNIVKKILNDADSFDDCQPSLSKLENRQRCQKP